MRVLRTHDCGCAGGWRGRASAAPVAGALFCCVFLACFWVHGVTIEAVSGVLQNEVSTTDAQGVSYSDTQLEVDLLGVEAGTNVLVIANFSSKASAPLIGRWKLVMDGTGDEDGDTTANFEDSDYPFVSDEMVRFVKSPPNNQGMVTIVHVFENLPPGDHTFGVYHRDNNPTAGNNLTTYHGNIAVVPLVTAEESASTLNYGLSVLPDRVLTTNSGSLEPVTGLGASIVVPAEGDIFVTAAFTGQTESANSKGTWRLALYDSSGNSRLQFLSNAVERKIATVTPATPGPEDVRDVTLTLVGVAHDVAAGTYTARLEHQTENSGGTPVRLYTANATVAAAALVLDDGRQFAALEQLGGKEDTNSDVFSDGLTESFELLEQSDVLVASHFGASSAGGQGGYFRVGVDGAFSEQGELYIDSASDLKSGGNIGLIEANAAGPHTSRLQYLKTIATGQKLNVEFPVLVTILLNTEASAEGGGAIDLYRATIRKRDGESVVDTCRARSLAEARRVFESRHVASLVTGIQYVRNARRAGYRLFLGGVRTDERTNIKDTCYAKNPSEAREILGGRYPGGKVNHMGLYYTNRRAVTWYAVTQRPDIFDEIAAEDLRDAHALFSRRFTRERVVRVVQESSNNEYATFEGLVDPGTTEISLSAESASQAAQSAAREHPGAKVRAVTGGASPDGIETYTATVHRPGRGTVTDNCLAKTQSEAQRILSDRHGDAVVGGLAAREEDRELEAYASGITTADKQTFTDVTRAKTAAEAATVFRARYPDGTVRGPTRADAPGRYREYQGAIHTPDGRNVRDTCWAVSPAEARKVFAARFPGGSVSSVSIFGRSLARRFEVTLKWAPRKEVCQARDKAEALKILLERFPQGRVATLRQLKDVPERPVYRATLNTRDHRTVIDTVEATSPSEAKELFEQRHPGARFLNLHRVTEGRVDEVYEAQIDLPPAKDTCQASSVSEARNIFRARYPRSSTGGLRRILAGAQ